MAQPPRTRAIQREALPDAPEWFEPALHLLNEFMGQTGSALSSGLTIGENVAGFYHEAKVRIPAVTWTPLKLQNGWGKHASDAVPGLSLRDGWPVLRGLLRKGSSTTLGEVVTNIPEPYRPATRVVRTAYAYLTGSAGGQAPLVIYANGNVTIDYAAPGPITDLGLEGITWEPATPIPTPFYSGNDWPLQFQNRAGGRPSVVTIAQAIDTDTLLPASCGTPAWNLGPNGNIQVHHVPGLTPGRSYNLRFLIMA